MRCLQDTARVVLALWLVLAPVKAWAGSMMLLGAGGGSAAPVNVQSPLILVSATAASNSSTNYGPLFGGINNFWAASTTDRETPIAVGGQISNLLANFPSGVGAGSYQITLRQNGADSALTCTISSGTSCTAAGPITVVAGDTLGWKIVPTTTPTSNTLAQFEAVFTASGNQTTIAIPGGGSGASTVAANYATLGGFGSYNATETQVSVVVPTNGTIDTLYIVPNAAPGAAPKQYVLTLYKNGVATGLTCTSTGATAAAAKCNDLVNSVAVVAGDLVSLEICPGTTSGIAGSCTPANGPTTVLIKGGVRFVGSTSGEAVLFTTSWTSGGVPGASGTLFLNYAGAETTGNGTETNRSFPVPAAMTFKKLQVYQTPQPGSGVTRSLVLRAGTGSGQSNSGTPSALGCTVAAGTGSPGVCSDATDSYAAASNNIINWQTSTSGVNTTLTTYKVGVAVTLP